MKVLFIGVFNPNSTNWSQAESLERQGAEVIQFDYRERNKETRDSELAAVYAEKGPDFVLLAKANPISNDVLKTFKRSVKAMWYCDPYPMGGWDVITAKIKLCNFAVCDKIKAVNAAKKITQHSYHVCEGYDPNRDKPFDLPQDIDVSFIGRLKKDHRGPRLEKLRTKIKYDLQLFDNVYGEEHAKIVSRSKININFCTRQCASDRVYKTMAAGGFLLTDKWAGWKNMFQEGKDLVFFDDLDDLADKIDYYMKRDEERKLIAEQGRISNVKNHRDNWAKRILEIAGTFR